METTQLYVELVLIGMESLFGFGILLANILGREIVYNTIAKLDSLGGTIVSIGTCYIVGLVIDRFADMLFQKKENKKRKESGLQAKSVMLLDWDGVQTDYFEFCRSRIRVLRATFLNSIFLGISLIIYVLKHKFGSLVIFGVIVVTTIFVAVVCYKSHELILYKYYTKARIIEKEKKRD